jgi:hypothetical protein
MNQSLPHKDCGRDFQLSERRSRSNTVAIDQVRHTASRHKSGWLLLLFISGTPIWGMEASTDTLSEELPKKRRRTANDALDPRATRTPIIAKARIFAMMRPSSSNKLTTSQGRASAPSRAIEKLRYVSRRVKLSSNDSYRSSLGLLRAESVPSHNRLFQRREIG